MMVIIDIQDSVPVLQRNVTKLLKLQKSSK